MQLIKGNWYTQTNGCIYEVLSIDIDGNYQAEGLNYEGRYLKAREFGNINDGQVFEGMRLSTEEEIERVKNLRPNETI